MLRIFLLAALAMCTACTQTNQIMHHKVKQTPAQVKAFWEGNNEPIQEWAGLNGYTYEAVVAPTRVDRTRDIPPLGSRIIPNSWLHQPPYSAMGRIIGTNVQGQRYACSGAVVAPNVIVTAAHCVREARCSNCPFNRNVQFTLQFPNNVNTSVTASNFFIGADWATQGLWSRDVAFVVAPGAAAGATPLAVLFDGGTTRWTYACGYPGAQDYAMTCTYNPSSNGGGGNMKLPSKLSSGASGGPWVTNLRVNQTEHGRNLVFGVNSHIFPGKAMMYSPIFGSLVNSLYQKATSV